MPDLQIIDGGRGATDNLQSRASGRSVAGANPAVEDDATINPSLKSREDYTTLVGETARKIRSDASDFIEQADPMENYAKDYVDQRFETERVKTDSRFNEVLSEIRMLKQSSLSKGQFWAGVATTVASILGVLLAVLAFAGDRFDAGVSISGNLRAIEDQQADRDAAQDARLDQILTAIEALRAGQP